MFFILRDSSPVLVNLLSYGLVFLAINFCCSRVFSLLWFTGSGLLSSVASWCSPYLVQRSPPCLPDLCPPLSQAHSALQVSNLPLRRRRTSNSSIFIGRDLTSFLAWFLRQAVLCGLTLLWCALFGTWPLLAPTVALPIFFIITSAL